MARDLQDVRDEYLKRELTKLSVDGSPHIQFESWLDDAKKEEILHYNAMALATVDSHQRPSMRTVLLKESKDNSYIFYTNYESHKGVDLLENQNASLLFYWRELERQVRIEGKVKKVSYEKSNQYFQSRPRGSQIAASISEQSREVSKREELQKLYEDFEREYAGKEIPCPKFWGGYELVADRFEFWQGRANRLHDRVNYQLIGSDWKISRLAP